MLRFLRRTPDAPPPGWEAIVARRVRHWHYLDHDERSWLGSTMARLLAEKRWEAAYGFALTDEMQLTIASLASLLVLGLDGDYYRHVKAIVVHPTTMVLTGPRPGPVSGVMTDAPMPILGQAHHHQGPVFIAWDAAAQDTRHPGRGHNVVFHEFAHKLDMLDDVVDGTPPLQSATARQRWIEVCTREYEALRRGETHLLRSYASVNPGEFFAVATEVFFDQPVEMRAELGDLYEALSGFYRQDPAARVERGANP